MLILLGILIRIPHLPQELQFFFTKTNTTFTTRNRCFRNVTLVHVFLYQHLISTCVFLMFGLTRAYCRDLNRREFTSTMHKPYFNFLGSGTSTFERSVCVCVCVCVLIFLSRLSNDCYALYVHAYILIVLDVITELDAEHAKAGLDIALAFPQATPSSKFPPCGKKKQITMFSYSI